MIKNIVMISIEHLTEAARMDDLSLLQVVNLYRPVLLAYILRDA